MDGDRGIKKILIIDRSTHLFNLDRVVWVTIISALILFWFNFDKGSLFAFGVMFPLDVFPALYMHIQYYLTNKDEAYEIDSDKIVRLKKEKKEIFKSEDIDKITLYMHPTTYKKSR